MDKSAVVIVVGNEKGGTGKSTISMHMAIYYLYAGYNVATIDLDGRQGTLTRYIENRIAYAETHQCAIPIPEHLVVTPGQNSTELIREHDEAKLNREISDLSKEYDIIIIDTPGSYNYLSHAGHQNADILVTPLNDSLVDLDVLAHVDPVALHMKEPSIYAETVWNVRQERAAQHKAPLKWYVLRNRLSYLYAHNKEQMSHLLQEISERLKFHFIEGLGERVIYRELFLDGLTLLDMDNPQVAQEMSLSHVAARQELRSILEVLNVPRVHADKHAPKIG